MLEVWAQQNDPSVEKYQVENFSNLLPKVHSLRTVGKKFVSHMISTQEQNQIHHFPLILGSYLSYFIIDHILGSAGINLALIAAGNADAYAQVGKFLLVNNKH